VGDRRRLVEGHRGAHRHRRHNARTEAANTGIKQIKRTGRGYRNAGNYRARILLASAARTAA
jgi:transposase